MDYFLRIGIWLVLSASCYFSQLALAEGQAQQEYAVLQCPEGYAFSHSNELYDGQEVFWNICIDSELYSDHEEGEDIGGVCASLGELGQLQAWNPDTSICFSIVDETANNIFTVVRNGEKNTILVDLYGNKTEAGCYAGSGEAYLLSPNEVYCLKDIGEVDGYNFSEIEAMAEAYFELLFSCDNYKSDDAQTLANTYDRYLEFAYYSNPSITINWGLSERTGNSRKSTDNGMQQGFDLKAALQDPCKSPHVSKMIGINN